MVLGRGPELTAPALLDIPYVGHGAPEDEYDWATVLDRDSIRINTGKARLRVESMAGQ